MPGSTFAGWRRLRVTEDPVAYSHRMLINVFLSERRLRRSSELPVGELSVQQVHGHRDAVSTTAAELNLSEAAVKNRTSRALRRLRDLLADDIDTDIARSTP